LKNNTKKYVISGIGPGSCGVGRLMNSFKPRYKLLGYKVIHKRNQNSLKEFLNQNKYFSFLKEIFLRKIFNWIFLVRLHQINGCEIILIHPQTVGYKASIRLIKKNLVTLYVMDNSFFCIQSYNYNSNTKMECLKCISKIDPDKECNSYPQFGNKKEAIEYLLMLKKYSEKITFYSQNKIQKDLLEMHFGNKINIKIIGMSQSNITLHKNINLENRIFSYKKFDIVYHGSLHPAKGIYYFINLAKYLPELSFLVPEEFDKLKAIFNNNLPKNIYCFKMTWETGLKEFVVNAKLVVNPSLWSAPIEGALIKSAEHNDNVATVISKFGFEAEFKGIKNHLRLDNDVLIASRQILYFLNK